MLGFGGSGGVLGCRGFEFKVLRLKCVAFLRWGVSLRLQTLYPKPPVIKYLLGRLAMRSWLITRKPLALTDGFPTTPLNIHNTGHFQDDQGFLWRIEGEARG